MSNMADHFTLQRHVFGICPHCEQVFRLSEIKISHRGKFQADWLDEYESEAHRLEDARTRWEESIKKKRTELTAKVRKREFPKRLRRLDRTFYGRGYWPRDVRLLVSPIEYIIFDGMDAEGPGRGQVSRVVLFDALSPDRARQRLQESIATAISKKRCDWKTIRVAEDGQVSVE